MKTRNINIRNEIEEEFEHDEFKFEHEHEHEHEHELDNEQSTSTSTDESESFGRRLYQNYAQRRVKNYPHYQVTPTLKERKYSFLAADDDSVGVNDY